jgi:hypothetical protein
MAIRYLAVAPNYIIVRDMDADALAATVTERMQEGYNICGSLVSLQGNVLAQTMEQHTQIVEDPAP